MAHHGVLVLDELPEFSAQVLDSLRQPLEYSEAVIARGYYRILKVARTIADLDGAAAVARVQAAEALTYRFRPAIPVRAGSGIVA